MKKTFFVILLLFLMILVGIYMNYKELLAKQTEAQKFNRDFTFYQKDSILGTDITTVINKAIDNNEKFNIPKDENGLYKEDSQNSMKIYVYMMINDTKYPMEALKKSGLNEFATYFGEIKFKCTDVKYHKATGKIAEMTFEALQI